MSASNERNATQPFGMPMVMPGGGQEIYEQVLALADKVGAAYAEAFQQLDAAYTEAYQKAAPGAGGLADKLAGQRPLDWLNAVAPAAAGNDQMGALAERVLAINDGVSDMGRKIALAFLEASQQAILAAADCQEQLGATSYLGLIKATATTQAALARKITRAGFDTIREIVA
jgi:hypothetical protein